MRRLLTRLFRAPVKPETAPLAVLVVEGGGVRGLVTGQILARLERALGAPLRQHFDLLAGTSSGGIQVLALATDSVREASELATIFHSRSDEVFRRTTNPVRLPPLLRGPRYMAQGFEQVAKDILGDAWLSDCKVPTIVTSYLIEEGRLKLFGSLSEEDDVGDDYRLVDVARATTAAPAFFPPAEVISRQGKRFWGVDGGVYANAPILQAVSEARRRFGSERRIELVSIGPGDEPFRVKAGPAQQWGGISWLKPAFDIQVQALSEQSHRFVAEQVPGVRLHRLAVDWNSLPASLRPTDGLDDHRALNLDRLNDGCLRWLDNNDALIKAVRDAVQQTRT